MNGVVHGLRVQVRQRSQVIRVRVVTVDAMAMAAAFLAVDGSRGAVWLGKVA